jgi:ferredoxin
MSSFSSSLRMSFPARNRGRTSALRDPRQGNVDGQFFVDHTCIDCDTCRWMAPSTFARVGNGSSVVHQPEDRAARIAAIQATLSCPTYDLSVTSDVKSGAAPFALICIVRFQFV